MWEFCSDRTRCALSDPDLGFTYGNAVITKRASDGRWVVLVTSGYNNVSPGTGRGYLFILDALTGAVLQKLDDGAGSTTSPSGLGRISAYADDFQHNNTAKYVYGGDLAGNVWRFDLTASPATAMKLGTLSDAAGRPQSVTTRPELALINGALVGQSSRARPGSSSRRARARSGDPQRRSPRPPRIRRRAHGGHRLPVDPELARDGTVARLRVRRRRAGDTRALLLRLRGLGRWRVFWRVIGPIIHILRHDVAHPRLRDLAVLGDLLLRPLPALRGGEHHLDRAALVPGGAAEPVRGVRAGGEELRLLDGADPPLHPDRLALRLERGVVAVEPVRQRGVRADVTASSGPAATSGGSAARRFWPPVRRTTPTACGNSACASSVNGSARSAKGHMQALLKTASPWLIARPAYTDLPITTSPQLTESERSQYDLTGVEAPSGR
jgi:hypothetical protein